MHLHKEQQIVLENLLAKAQLQDLYIFIGPNSKMLS